MTQPHATESATHTAGRARRGHSSRHPFEIEFTIKSSLLGLVLVAHTDIGVCAVLLGDDRDELRRDLASRFPSAKLSYAAPRGEGIAARVVSSINGVDRSVPLPPLDLVGTEFQSKVWNALMHIPAGATVSYSQLAARIGRPTAARAVASACSANSVAVLVPCHRAVGANGSLTGYRWGVQRKKQLLENEKKFAGDVESPNSRSTHR
jgi:AraC family transcriptional regulator of adaptative response/methylated-DNA-[protein]-cysteine methyltransferase